ncbi:MAG: hypothetical protein J7L15_00030 [Clostridiales bacterium]|nr:hypothetical protein [Clostridiales bacterium]
MKFKANEIINHIGDIVKIVDNKSVKDGTYQIVESNVETGYDILYDIHDSALYTITFDPSELLVVIYTPPAERLEFLYEAFTKIAMQLMNDGIFYDEDENDQAMNYIIGKIKTTKMLIDANNMQNQTDFRYA